MRKRIVSIALSAVVALSCLSVPAFAAEQDTPYDTAGTASVQTTPAPEMTTEETDLPEAVQETDALPVQTDAAAATETVPEAQPAETAEEQLPEETSEPEVEDDQLLYVALGDSITAGVGLSDLRYTNAEYGFDFSENYTGYSSECYVAQVAQQLGLDREHAINLGLPGLMSVDLVELVQTGKMEQLNQGSGAWYNIPQMTEYIRKADIISIQIGSNDALVPVVVALGNATNWKSETLANSILGGFLREPSLEHFETFIAAVKKLSLTAEERKAVDTLLTSGMQEICEQAAAEYAANLKQVVASIRAVNPDAQIILVGCYNPVFMLPTWAKYFNSLCSYEKQLAREEGLQYAAIPFTITATDAHPTESGHKYIARQIVKAINKK